MKYQTVFFLYLVFLLLACNKEETITELVIVEDPEEEVILSDFEKDLLSSCISSGNIPSIPTLNREDQLLKIERNTNNNEYIDSFIYDQTDLLIAIEQLHNNGRIYEFEYNNDFLVQVSTFDPTPEKRLIFRDSLIYNSDDKLQLVYSYSTNAGPGVPIAYVDSFHYDQQGYLTHHSSFSVPQNRYSQFTIFCWTNGNLTHILNYDDEGEIRSESLGTYSDEEELKIAHLDPRQWMYPYSWSSNKNIESNFIDHVGNIDFLCDPCFTEFTYDEDNRLILQEGDIGFIRYTYRD